MFWLPISLLFSSKIILKQLFASGSVNIPKYLLRLRRIIVKYNLVVTLKFITKIHPLICDHSIVSYLIIYIQKLLDSDWLKTSAFFV